MNCVIIQSPLVQLNTFYPAGAYLKSFFVNQGLKTTVYDGTVALFNQIFCRKGIKTLFDLTQQKALKMAAQSLKQGDQYTAQALRQYIYQKDLWIDWIDNITAILRDGTGYSTREICHRFIFSPYVPRGIRMSNFIENLDHDLTIDDARFLASWALADLSDYITAVFDKEFSLVRYGESLAINETSFAEIQKGIDSPVLTTYYQQVLEQWYGDCSQLKSADGKKTLICISVPFAGTFAASLYAGRFFKQKLGNECFVVMGGGFVNTELRDVQDTDLSKYIDAISYDRGYGSYLSLLDSPLVNIGFDINTVDKSSSYYKLRIITKDFILEPDHNDKELIKKENELTAITIPDFSDVDFSQYPRMTDDVNPMHRMWSDGTWIKAYLAHGCYWHQCDFCDVTLDYVKSYHVTRIPELYKGLLTQAKTHGVYGLHFVDEALPPLSTAQFALLNAKQGTPLNYWGNVRFEKTYTKDLADFLSYGGLMSVSGGIEIATGTGLDNIHKGTDIDSIVGACCAFKEAGILVHAYMIYGYYNQSEVDMINSMETLRQLYACGLLDSSFWHKFVLTRHSRIYDEYKKGMHPDLKPLEDKGAGIFAKNGMHFVGEQKSEKYGPGLNAALQAWMHGQGLNKSVTKWFDFNVSKPTIAPDYIEQSIAKYEQRKKQLYNAPIDITKLYYLGGSLIVNNNGKSISGMYMDEEFSISLKGLEVEIDTFIKAVTNLRPDIRDTSLLESIINKDGVDKSLHSLRPYGLVQIGFKL